MSGTITGQLPVNIALEQPIAGYFRLYEVIRLLDQQQQVLGAQTGITALQTTTTNMQASIAGLQAADTFLQGQIDTINAQIAGINGTTASLQSQIDTLNARLAAAGIP